MRGSLLRLAMVLAVLAAALPARPAAARKGKAAPAGGKRPSAAAVQTLRRGLRAYEEARFDEALELLSQALEQHPGWKTATAFRSVVLWTTGDVASAQRDAQLGLGLNPIDAESFAARGFSRFVLKHMDLAAKDFVRAAKLDAQYPLAYFGMGSVRSSQKKLPEALTNLNIAIKLSPRAAAAYIVRGTVHGKMGQHAKAVSDFSQVARLAPGFHWAFYYRGRAYRDLKDYPKAIDDFTRFMAHFPDSEDALYYRSNAYFLTGNYQGALQDLDRLLELDPKHALGKANRGMAKNAMGDREGALADLRGAKALDPARADKIQEQIDRIEAEAVTGASPPKTEITGTPGKGLGAQGEPESVVPRSEPPPRPKAHDEPSERIRVERPEPGPSKADLPPQEEPVPTEGKKGAPPARLPMGGSGQADDLETSGDVLFIK